MDIRQDDSKSRQFPHHSNSPPHDLLTTQQIKLRLLTKIYNLLRKSTGPVFQGRSDDMQIQTEDSPHF